MSTFQMLAIAFFLLATQGTVVHTKAGSILWGVDLYEGDLQKEPFEIPMPDPTLCEDKCLEVTGCVAWTYVRPNTVQGSRPLCWLKNVVPAVRKCPHCVAGCLRGADCEKAAAEAERLLK